VSNYYDEPFSYWKSENRQSNLLKIFRCYQVSVFINSLINDTDRPLVSALRKAAVQASLSAQEADATVFLTSISRVSKAARSAAFAGSANSKTAIRNAEAAQKAAFVAITALDAVTAFRGVATAIDQDLDTLLGANQKRFDCKRLLEAPLWLGAMPGELEASWKNLKDGIRWLDAGFDIWINWYSERLEGIAFEWEVEREWALISDSRLAQSPAEINAYLRGLREKALSKQLRRVRAIFIGHGGVGKTSLIRALHGEDVTAGMEAMTLGVAINDAIHERAGVFTRITDYKDDDLTIHFWDFGGQVMAHATHQFFLRSKCLYVIVLEGRSERNTNEEAEYWLEHVRAFGDSAPVLLVGNKADVMTVSLDLQTLKNKYPNIVDFYLICCTQAKGAYRRRFELFHDDFIAKLQALGKQSERFSPAQFKVLKCKSQDLI
jgi:signal recognition particle receptor subunit beta